MHKEKQQMLTFHLRKIYKEKSGSTVLLLIVTIYKYIDTYALFPVYSIDWIGLLGCFVLYK